MRRGILAGALSLGLALGGFLPGIASAQVFEGVVRYSIHDDQGKTVDVVQLTKHGKISTAYTQQGKTFGIIVDSSAGTVTIVTSEDKSYMVLSQAAMQQMMQGMQGMVQGMQGMLPHRGGTDSSKAEAPQVSVTRTGSSVVAGIPCEAYAYDGMDKGKHMTGELCFAKGVGAMFTGGGMGMMGMQRQPGMQDRLRAWGPVGNLFAQGYGLLKATYQENGKPKGSIEVTGIQRGAPPDAQFKPPAGFTEKSMGGMMRMGHDSH